MKCDWEKCAGSPARYVQPQPREWDREEENYRDRQPRIWTEPPPPGSEAYTYFSPMSALAALGGPAAKNLARMIEASHIGAFPADQVSRVMTQPIKQVIGPICKAC